MASDRQERREPSSIDREWVLSMLERDQLVQATKRPVPRRRLKGRELIVLWSLRLYLVFMVVVVIYQAWTGGR